MTLNLNTLIFFGLLTAGIHWLVARSSITKPIWSKATGKLDGLLRCAGCSGFWLGLALWIIGVRPIDGGIVLARAFLLTGVLGAALTPVVEAVVLWGLAETAVEAPAESTPSESVDAHGALDAIMDRLCGERSDLSPDEIERIGGTVKRALGLEEKNV